MEKSSPYVARPRRVPAQLTAAVGFVERHALPLGILWLVSAGANAIVQRLHSPIPGSAVALLAMLVMLSTVRPAAHFFEATAVLLTRHLSLFFVPLAIGILGSWSAFVPIAVPLGVTLAVSVATGIAATGLVAQRLYRGRPR